jgi:glucose/arabinose dehydrogenase
VPADIASKVQLVEVAKDLKRPVAFVVAPGDARGRWFVVEQHRGRIQIFEGGAKQKPPFFDIDGKVSTGNEQGLLGLAFHPKFATNKKLYVHYTDTDDHTHVVEYTVSADDPDRVDMATAREVFFHKQPYSNHNGGHLLFGPDGKLWIGLGDGGGGGDPLRAGQDMDQLLAKILRLDVDKPGAKPEIVHLGVRNPWRYAFDPKTGDFFIGDVGQNKWEYVFVVAGGDTRRHNFGWNIAEGRHCYNKRTCDRSGFTEPVVDYSHDEGCSLTGGVVYRGKAIPTLDGVYFYADYCTSLFRSFRFYRDTSDPAGGVARDHWNWRGVLDPGGRVNSISSFGVDADGEIYVVTLVGSIFKLVPKS